MKEFMDIDGEEICVEELMPCLFVKTAAEADAAAKDMGFENASQMEEELALESGSLVGTWVEAPDSVTDAAELPIVEYCQGKRIAFIGDKDNRYSVYDLEVPIFQDANGKLFFVGPF